MVQASGPKNPGGTEVSRQRIALIGGLLLFWMLIVILRLTYVQVVDHDRYVRLSQEDEWRSRVIAATRGSILDRNNVVLAMSVDYQSVLLDQYVFNQVRLSKKDDNEAKREEALATRRSRAVSSLSSLLEMSETELAAKLVGNNRHLWLKRKLPPDRAELVRKAIAELPGISIINEMERFYPNQELAAQLIGYLGQTQDGIGQTGRAGIERRFETFMAGESGKYDYLVDGRGTPQDRLEFTPRPGQDVQLTIDSVLQRKVEYLLRQAVDRHRAKGGGVAVMDPDNGEILALASYPTFDPNRIEPNVATSPGYVNQPIMSPYEPGSIFKVVTYAAALDQGIVHPDDTIDCGNGNINIGERVIRDTHSFGQLTVEDSFARSSNVGAIRIAQRLGKSTFHRYIRDFGFGRPTGIELPAESSGIVHDPAKWRPDSIGSVAIGQEISVTLVQAVRAVAVIANGGYLVAPHLIKRIAPPGDKEANSHQADISSQQERSRVISEETARQMRQLMQRVVTHGTARQTVQIDGYTVAGKTGTPQKSGQNGYGQGRYMPSFLGFAPATKPKFAVVVMIDEPSDGNYYGGVVAAPVFSMVTEVVLKDNSVLPDERGFRERMDQLVRQHSVPGSVVDMADGDDLAGGQSTSGKLATALPPPVLGPGAAAAQNRVQGVAIREVSAAPNLGSPSTQGGPSAGVVSARQVMPDLRGRDMKTAVRICSELRLVPRLIGNGLVIKQSPPVGAVARPGVECRLEFKSR